MSMRGVVLGVALLSMGVGILPLPVLAEELLIHGFLQANYDMRVTGQHPPGPEGGDFLFGEERLQLRLDKSGEKGRLFIRTDFFHDAVTNRPDLEMREAYVDTSMG